MKHFVLFFISCIILFNVTAQKNKISTVYFYKKVNIFIQHLSTLDSMMKFGGDHSPRCFKLVEYMERITNTKAHPEFNCWGSSRYFTWVDLGLWNTWYKNIGSKRIGIIL